MRIVGRFTGEVSGIKFGEGCVEVVGVEQHACRRSFLGIDLDHVESIEVEGVWTPVLARISDTIEGETRAAGGNHV